MDTAQELASALSTLNAQITKASGEREVVWSQLLQLAQTQAENVLRLATEHGKPFVTFVNGRFVPVSASELTGNESPVWSAHTPDARTIVTNYFLAVWTAGKSPSGGSEA